MPQYVFTFLGGGDRTGFVVFIYSRNFHLKNKPIWIKYGSIKNITNNTPIIIWIDKKHCPSPIVKNTFFVLLVLVKIAAPPLCQRNGTMGYLLH